MSAEKLKGHLETLKRFAAETQAQARQSPDDFLLQLAAKNQADSADSVQQELALAVAEEIGELVDLRLIGPRAQGSISLDWFIKGVEPLSKAWKLAAHRLRHGTEAARGAAVEVVSALNLKLAGVSYGSTRIFITGNATPDLTGESLLQATLIQTFRLLNANHDEFYDAIDAIGGKSAHQLSEFMRALDDFGLAAEVTWQSPKGMHRWEGRPDEITRLRTLLDAIREPEQYQEEIGGRVAGISDTGRLELRTEDGKITLRFPLKLTQEVQRLTITAPTRLRVLTSRYWDGVEKRDIFKRQLLEVLYVGSSTQG